jgi:hypothetical protein
VDDLSGRWLTNDEAFQAMRRAVNAWRDRKINPAEALARIGDAIGVSGRLANES